MPLHSTSPLSRPRLTSGTPQRTHPNGVQHGVHSINPNGTNKRQTGMAKMPGRAGTLALSAPDTLPGRLVPPVGVLLTQAIISRVPGIPALDGQKVQEGLPLQTGQDRKEAPFLLAGRHQRRIRDPGLHVM
mmetsp:Transcript_64614/g.154391  ORF Transcript_64614/g.154391 Transcript_64614/m.154391 type:complete len:131 (+) Transcript_64614:1156-1548(+)